MPNVDRALLTSLCAALIIGLIPTAPVQAADVSSVVMLGYVPQSHLAPIH
jgi:hypothetical protein